MENKSNSKTIIAVLITLLICVIGFCIYLIINDSNKVNNDNNGEVNNKTENKENNNIKIENEVELTDETVKADVLDKMNVIFGFTNLVNKNDYSTVDKFSLNNNLVEVYFMHLQMNPVIEELINKNSKLTYKQKLSIALYNTESTKLNVTIDDIDFPEKTKYDMWNKFNSIKIKDLEITFKNIFNEELTTYESDICFGGYCYYYDKVNDIYYEHDYGKGGAGYLTYMFYINSITTNDEYIYLNINTIQKSGDLNEKKCYVNDGILDSSTKLSNNSLYTGKYEYSNDSLINECENYTIDESNYKEFTNYRFVFKKNSEGNYYFDKVEKVK